MKFLHFVSIGLILVTTFTVDAQNRIQLSAETASKSFDFSNYEAIDVASDFEVNVRFSTSEASLVVTANENLLDKVDIYQKGKTLYFRLQPKTNTRGKMILDVELTTAMLHSFVGSSDAIIHVKNTIKHKRVDLSLSSDAQFTGDIEANNLRIEASSDAKINSKVTVEDCDLKAKSDAIVNLAGTIERLDASLSSDSQFKNKNLTIKDVDIKMSGDSQAWIRITNSLEASASGDSVLKYTGNPRLVNRRVTGDAKIIEVD